LWTVPTDTLVARAIVRIDSPVGVAGEDDASLVGVDDAGSAAGAAAGAGGGEPVAGLADDVAAAVFG